MLTHQKERISLFFKGNVEELTREPALRALIIMPFKRLKNLFFGHAKFPKTHCFQTKYVSNIFRNAMVTQTFRVQCATNRNCSQKFHICLQLYIASSGSDELCDGWA